jgi:P27 family predicted phage terminase small subunit
MKGKQKLPKTAKTRAPAPEHLSEEAQKLWRRLTEEFEIDDPAGLLLLQSALESFDDMRKAQDVVKRDGITILDRWGQQRQNPATLVLRDSRNLMLRALKQLNLDVVPGAPLK